MLQTDIIIRLHAVFKERDIKLELGGARIGFYS